jgi:hypothetical protein
MQRQPRKPNFSDETLGETNGVRAVGRKKRHLIRTVAWNR